VGVTKAPDVLEYLGRKLVAKCRRNASFDDVLDEVGLRLNGWRARNLHKLEVLH